MATVSTWFSAMPAPADRKAIAAGLRRRDPDLLDHLIEVYEYRLYRYLLCLIGSRETAEDLFQETWIRVLDRGHQYRDSGSFEAWLFTIARHLVIDLSRRAKSASLDDVAEPPATGDPSPLEAALRSQRADRIQDALARVPAVYREVLLLRFQEELPLSEIASVIDAPLATAKSRLYRGIEALRQELGDAYA